MSSIRNKVGNAIAGKATVPFSQEAMKKIGVQTISTERISERKAELHNFHETLSTRPPTETAKQPDLLFEWYVDKLYKVWNMYKENQVAWARAGSNGDLSIMVTAINTMMTTTEIAIEGNRDALARYNQVWKKAEEKQDECTKQKVLSKKMQIVREFNEAWLIKNVLEYVQKMGDLCWFVEDVGVPETFPIMTNQPIKEDRAKVNEEMLGPEDDKSE